MRKGRNGPRFGEKNNFGTSRDLDLSNFLSIEEFARGDIGP